MKHANSRGWVDLPAAVFLCGFLLPDKIIIILYMVNRCKKIGVFLYFLQMI